VGVALLLLLVYWIADVALDAFFTGERVFLRFVLAPPPHVLAERFLALLLTCCFLHYSSRVSKVRVALERALQEALLKAESERTKVVAIVEAMGDAISIQDPQLNVLYQNRAHRELRGSHVGERCYEAYRHKSEVCSGCHLVEAFSDGAVHRVEIEAQRGERMLCLEVIASPLRDPHGGIMAGIEVMRDITDRKLAEQAARKEAALLQHLIDTIPSPIYHQDLSGRFLWCNTAFAAWLAKPRELIIGRTLAEVAPVQLCQIFAEDEPGPCRGTVREASWLRGDGVACDVIFYKSMFIDDAGQSGGVVGVVMDIAKRKRAEAKVIGLNAALTRQACELHQANRELEAFSHAISHDLRSPLTRIYSSGQALQEYGDQLDENGAFFVQSINDGCVQMDLLLDSLMVLSRVTEMELVTDQVDLSSLARDLASELQRSEPGRRVSFLIAQAIRVQGDPQLLHLALENLIGNAWKYTSGVSLPRIEFGSQLSAEGETVFFLKDNGAGFDGARSDQLFKPFRRLHSSQEFPGTGLGLATVRRIIRRHNGRVWAEGKPGCGATFYFTVNG
jgi:PAS domain S-box-containing protein